MVRIIHDQHDCHGEEHIIHNLSNFYTAVYIIIYLDIISLSSNLHALH